VYEVAAFEVQAAPAGPPDVRFADGWHGVEAPDDAQALEWRWSKRTATVLLRNPGRDSVVWLELDQPVHLDTGRQQVEVRVGDDVIDTFEVPPSQPIQRRIPVAAATLGHEEYAAVTLRVDRTFIPAQIGRASGTDRRELGVRVFIFELTPEDEAPPRQAHRPE
jgi:hypothetical protein